MGDIGGAAGTIFFQFVIGQILYAEQQNLVPWVHFDNTSTVIYDNVVHGKKNAGVNLPGVLMGRNATWVRRRNGHIKDAQPGPLVSDDTSVLRREDLRFAGTGVWEHYFEPVSDYVPGDRSCENKPYVTLNLFLITPGLHGFAEWAPKCWRYKYLPDYITKPHIPVTEWLEPQRAIAHRVVQQYIRLRPELRALSVNTDCSSVGYKNSSCLGLHIRHSDKAAGRRVVATDEFLPFARAFVHAGGQHIYLATDSQMVLKEIEHTWPVAVTSRIRTMGSDIVRSDNDTAVFDMGSHHRTNQEILVEIYALSQCQFMVHGFSAVSESAIWTNLDLHRQSVNLEDPDHVEPAMFGTLIQMVLRGEEKDHLPQPSRTDNWWNQSQSIDRLQSRRVSHTACEGYNGVLHISAVGNTESAVGSFFTSILNQLLYAEQHNLKPWVHLLPESSRLVFDINAHNGSHVSLEMIHGTSITTVQSITGTSYPGPLYIPISPQFQTMLLHGDGVWKNYFLPVSEFEPGDESCRVKPIVTMDENMVVPDLKLYSPTSIRAWQYDDLPDLLWNRDKLTLKDWYKPMRAKAHELVKKYYRFQPYIVKKAEEVNPMHPGEPCLAVHLRNSDKIGKHRKKIKAPVFLEYMEAFARAGGKHIFVASDSHRVLQYMEKSFPEDLLKLIRTQGKNVVRSYKEWPAHFIDNHHRVNSEALVDVVAMSKCHIILHGFSTLSEAAIYLNPNLHEQSVNLEDPDRMSPDLFEKSVGKVILDAKFQVVAPVEPIVEMVGSIETIDLEGSTILSRAAERGCRSNAVIYLAQKFHSSYGRDSYSNLLRSLDLLDKNYLSLNNHINNTDIFIFHTGDFDEADLEALETRVGHRGVFRLVDLTGSPFWARPKANRGDDPSNWYAYPFFSEGYRRMMHWYAIDVWIFFAKLNTETACQYRYLFRLDEDSMIHSPIRYDIFDFMQSHQYVYGFRMCAYELEVTRRMWTLWMQRHREFVPQRKIKLEKLETCGFYNNFFVADLTFFLDPDVQSFLRFIDQEGVIYRRRLGDLMIHSMAVYAFAKRESIHRFLDFTYEHATIFQTCIAWGGIQAGYDDPIAMETLNKYYQTHLLDVGCPGNATLLRHEDLSPSYNHLSEDQRQQISLYTITAGQVEVPNKGILSG
jgi:hypothetical protein